MEKKIAIITNTVASTEEEYHSARMMAAKYGDRIIHVTWPNNFLADQEQMITIMKKLAFDPEVKAVVINQSVPGTNMAVGKLLETRKDVFIVYCTPQDDLSKVTIYAHLALMFDEHRMGSEVPIQAKKMGAKAFVHYSFPRHMAISHLSKRRDLMKEKCAEIGLEFADVMTPDPVGPGLPAAVRFFTEDIPRKVEKYGKDTAFFSTNCAMQMPLIRAVMNAGAIFPLPCCPSPYHGFMTALGIEPKMEDPDDLQRVIDEIRRIFKEKGLEGRFATWPVPGAIMLTIAGTEYAMKVISGEVSRDGLNIEVLRKCLSDYAKVDVSTMPYVDDDGKEHPNFLMTIMESITF